MTLGGTSWARWTATWCPGPLDRAPLVTGIGPPSLRHIIISRMASITHPPGRPRIVTSTARANTRSPGDRAERPVLTDVSFDYTFTSSSQLIAQHFGLLCILGLFIMMRLLNKEIFIKKPYIPPSSYIITKNTQNNTNHWSCSCHNKWIIFYTKLKKLWNHH